MAACLASQSRTYSCQSASCCVPPHSTVQQEGALLLCLQVDTKGLAIIDASVAPAAQELWLSGASHTQLGDISMLVASKKPAHCLQQAPAETVCTVPMCVILTMAVHGAIKASPQVPTCIMPDRRVSLHSGQPLKRSCAACMPDRCAHCCCRCQGALGEVQLAHVRDACPSPG